MTISNTVYTILSASEVEFDVNELITSLLLFDNVLVSNPGVVPDIVRAIGIEGLISLVSECRLAIVGPVTS